METEQAKKQSIWKKNIWTWKMEEADLRNQVDNYQRLKITESYRGTSVIVTLIILALTISVGFILNTADLVTVIVLLLIYIPILLFVLKGQRWAIILLMILWTADHLYTLLLGGSLMTIIWWIIVFSFYRKAWLVENARRQAPAAAQPTA